MSELYRPGNGTEGDIFMSRFCYRCKRDEPEGSCDILTATMFLGVDDDGYPTEWVTDDYDTAPPRSARCTAFEMVS